MIPWFSSRKFACVVVLVLALCACGHAKKAAVKTIHYRVTQRHLPVLQTTVPASAEVSGCDSAPSLTIHDVGADASTIHKTINPPGGVLMVVDDTRTIKNTRINGGIDFYGKTLTLENVIVEGGHGWWGFIVTRNADSKLIMKNSTIRSVATGDLDGDGILPLKGGPVDAQHIDISGSLDGAKISSNSQITHSYIHDLSVTSSSHNDGIQIMGGQNISLTDNFIAINKAAQFDPAHLDAAVFVQPVEQDPVKQLNITCNFLEGGGYTARFEGNTTDVSLTNNIFGPVGNGAYGDFNTQPSVVFTAKSGNVRGDESGTITGGLGDV